MDTVTLFVDNELDSEARSNLSASPVQILPYDSFFQHLKGLSEQLELSKDSVRHAFPRSTVTTNLHF
jgi:hypothetical protein